MTGVHHAAGHVGHIDSIDAAGLPCSCGQTGHVEAIASGPAIHRHYLRLGGDTRITDTKAVTALALAGDQRAHQALATGARAAGRAAASLANVLDPELVIVSGGMAGAGALWWNSLRQGFAESVIGPVAKTGIVAAELGNEAAFYGAASLFWPSTEKE